ncbi:peptidoglycan-binding protein [Pseudonocardia sp. RS11V-5]|uniref:peptidoglycan-binding domain-containing protein n=1 Tax=Pseudonocardia terrae TaxID=2905831 RepID=UPI001E43661E|nr:peptidoglycan-binding domain-containing protein [Pseudonocardia terrae]MCE3552137.1 peptidoglycan-binding protein [Pseudonocardia terrae]
MSTTDTVPSPTPQDPRDSRGRGGHGAPSGENPFVDPRFSDAPYSPALYDWARAHDAYATGARPAGAEKHTGRTVALTVGALVVAAGIATGLVFGLGYGPGSPAPAPDASAPVATAPVHHATVMPADPTSGTAGSGTANGGSSSGGHVTPPAPPTPSAAIETLQNELGQLNYYEGPVTGVMNKQTTQAITYLQRDAGLPQTGKMDAATQAALTKMLATGNSQMNGGSSMNSGSQMNGNQMGGTGSTGSSGRMAGMPGM